MQHAPSPKPASWLTMLCALAVAAQAQPLISELCDPHLNYQTDRFVEIHNPGASPLELDGWQLTAMANGAPAFTWTLSGVIQPGEALVAGDATTTTAIPVTFAEEGWSDANGSWNGKVGDGAVLRDPQGVAVDSVVVPGNAFENAVMTRLAEIDQPAPAYHEEEWEHHAVELATDATPGVHNAVQQPDGPAILAFWCDPALPAAGEPVVVRAVVRDDAAQIQSVWLSWGVAADHLEQGVPMAAFAADSFVAESPIPGQPAGTTVYWRISASNDIPALTESALRHYDLAHEKTIAELQGDGDASPYDGQPVRTRGVVTACFGADVVLQDQGRGLWTRGLGTVAVGDSLWVAGRIREAASPQETGLTLLSGAGVLANLGAGDPVSATTLATGEVAQERWESSLVEVDEAVFRVAEDGELRLDDGSGPCPLGMMAGDGDLVPGSTYRVRGVLQRLAGQDLLQPRGPEDVVWLGDHSAPGLLSAATQGPTVVRAVFSEALDSLLASQVEHFQVDGQTVLAAGRGTSPDQVRLVVESLAGGAHLLTVAGLADLHGNVMGPAQIEFQALETGEPAGYYDAAEGLSGDALKEALHEIIDDHDARSYEYAWTAYQTTDVRPDTFRVWDIYSDIPGGTPPYLYQFGVNEGGVGGQEGTGYTREHTWCKNWFGGAVMPMYSDLFTLFPCDTHMNGTRGVHAYGETASPGWTSLNGSRLGPSSTPGFSETVFEPIDEFKGDLARAYFYFSTRYLGEDEGWPGGPATDGAQLRPWALELYRAWHEADPVSQKEVDRNNAIYAIQGNRNPYVDRPGLVDAIQGVTALEPAGAGRPAGLCLSAHPNPFNPSTTFEFSLEASGPASLCIYNVAGQEVARLLAAQPLAAGTHRASWTGTTSNGAAAATGVYLARLEAGGRSRTLRVLLLR